MAFSQLLHPTYSYRLIYNSCIIHAQIHDIVQIQIQIDDQDYEHLEVTSKMGLGSSSGPRPVGAAACPGAGPGRALVPVLAQLPLRRWAWASSQAHFRCN